MKTFEEFNSQKQELEEGLPLLGIPAALKWMGVRAAGEAAWNLLKGGARTGGNIIKNTAGKAVSEVGKTAKKAWDGGENEIKHVKGRDEKGLPSSN